MGLTIAEALRARQMPDPTLAGVVRTFTDNAPVLDVMQFSNYIGQTVSVNRTTTLNTSAFRAIDSDYTASAGVTEQITQALKIAGGRVEIDRAVRKMSGPEAVAEQEAMQAASLARLFQYTFLKSAGASNSFTGLNTRITGDQILANGGGGLDLNLLNQAILSLRGGVDKRIIMGVGMEARLWEKANSNSQVNYSAAEFGVKPATYNGIPIMRGGEDASDAEILDFSEAASTTSIYVVAFNGNGVVGVQNAPIEIIKHDINSVDSSYDIEWITNYIIKTTRSAYVISGIEDLAVGADPSAT